MSDDRPNRTEAGRRRFAVLLSTDRDVARVADDRITVFLATLELSEEFRHNIQLVVSELVTNAHLHGHGGAAGHPIRLSASIGRAVARIIVEDRGSGIDTDNEPSLPETSEAPTGRGLFIVRELADRLDTLRSESGWTRVEAELSDTSPSAEE